MIELNALAVANPFVAGILQVCTGNLNELPIHVKFGQ